MKFYLILIVMCCNSEYIFFDYKKNIFAKNIFVKKILVTISSLVVTFSSAK